MGANISEAAWRNRCVDVGGFAREAARVSDLILGIDLGTTHSAVGVVDSGFAILLADKDGQRIMPSAVWLGKNGEIEVGRRALRRRALEPERVVTSIKRLMGRRSSEQDPHFSVVTETSAEGLPLIFGRSPEEISAEILRELRRIAEWRMGVEITRAVITVPAYFHDAQRAATKRAGELAGLEVIRILNEPTAAALAYGMDRLGEKARIAVYDLGGGTFDLSILEFQDGVFQVLATHGDTQLGGDDLDGLLLSRVLSRAGISELSTSTRAHLMAEAERVKIALSEQEHTVFRAPFYDGSQSLEQEISRADLEEIAAPWIAKTERLCRLALADANVGLDELSAVVVVGGSTRMPAVRRAVAAIFKREPDFSQHPDEAIALGATIQGGVLSGALRQIILLDVTPLSLGIETFGGLMNVLIPRNTTIPCKAGELFTNAAAGQESMRVRVLQGEREMAKDNWELGTFDVPFSASAKGQARVGVQFKIDENGILEALARDITTGTDTVIHIHHAAVDVDDAAVEAMVSESVEHAFTDMEERIFTEARLKAEELLPAVQAVLAQGLAQEDEREEILAAVAAVQAALAAGAANPLKAAVQRLDLATEALAARLVEQALDAALDRQLAGN